MSEFFNWWLNPEDTNSKHQGHVHPIFISLTSMFFTISAGKIYFHRQIRNRGYEIFNLATNIMGINFYKHTSFMVFTYLFSLSKSIFIKKLLII